MTEPILLASFEAMKVLIARPGLEPVTAPRTTVVDLASPYMVRACEPPPPGGLALRGAVGRRSTRPLA